MKSDRSSSSGNGLGKPKFHKVAECLYRRDSSGVYYALVKRGGKQFRRSLKTADRKLAERRLSEFRYKVGRLDQIKGAVRTTFAELADRWLAMIRHTLKQSSVDRRLDNIKRLKVHFGNLPVRNITDRTCEDWMTARAGKTSASTYNKEREALRLILGLAKREGLLLDNPALALPSRKMAKRKIDIPSHEQFRQMVAAIRDMDSRAHDAADLVEILAYSGMRLGEATAILWGDVDFNHGCFTVTGGQRGTKNHEVRTVPIFPALRDLLERFQSYRDYESSERIVRINDAKKAICSASKRAALPHYSHHTLRHYFVSNAIERGIDFKTIAAWIGHKDGGVLVAKTYGHLRDTHSFEMARLMTISAKNTPPHPNNVLKLPALG